MGGVSTEERLRLARGELENRIRGGETRVVEELLRSDGVLGGNDEAVVELVYAEYVVREELGEPPALAELTERFPRQAARLERLLRVHAELESASDDWEGRARGEATELASGDVTDGATDRLRASDGYPEESQSTRVGNYELLELVGQGGMGLVYRARQLSLRRIVALKMIRSPFALPTERGRFLREAESAARLHHPHIVQIYEVGSERGQPFLSMEFVEGGTLDARLRAQPLSHRQAAQLLVSVARAIDYAHQQRLVHRDLKPGNILLTLGGEPKITDFGLAKRFGNSLRGSDPQETLTQTGAVLGTPAYMAPEQLAGASHDVGPAVDIYALGAILYQLLVGYPPFRGTSLLDVFQQIRTCDPVPPRRAEPRVPRDLETICLCCLRKEPQRRYASAADLADDLQAFLEGRPIRARQVRRLERVVKWTRRRPAVAALLMTVVLVSLLGLGGILWQWSRAVAALRSEATMRRQVEQNLYYRQIDLAHREATTGDIERARFHLEQCPSSYRSFEWAVIQRICNAPAIKLSGHRAEIRGIDYSRNGRWMVTADGRSGARETGDVVVWDRDRLAEDHRVSGLDGPVLDVRFGPQDQWIGIVVEGSGFRCWDVEQRRMHQTWDGPFRCLAFLGDGQQVVTGDTLGTVAVWDVDRAKALQEFKGHDAAVTRVAVSPDGKWVASASEDASVRIWNSASGDLVSRQEVAGAVRDIVFSPDGTTLAAASEGGNVDTWSLRFLTELKTSWMEQLGVAMGHDVRFVPLLTKSATHHLHDGPVFDLDYSPNGQWLAAATASGAAHVLDPLTGKTAYRLQNSDVPNNVVRFAPDSLVLGYGGMNRAVHLRRVAQLDIPLRVTMAGLAIKDVAVAPDGHTVAIAGGALRGDASPHRAVLLYDSQRHQVTGELPVQRGSPTCVAFSVDGEYLAAADELGDVSVWETGDDRLVRQFNRGLGAVHDVAFHPHGPFLATASSRGTLALWEITKDPSYVRWKPAAAWPAHQGQTRQVVFAPSSSYIASGGDDRRVKLWDATLESLRSGPAESLTPAFSSEELAGAVRAIVWSRDARLLASSGGAKAYLWEVRWHAEKPPTVRRLHVCEGHADEIHAVAFTADAARLITASADSTLKIWDATTGQLVLTLRGRADCEPALAFVGQHSLLLSAWNEHLRIWDGSAETTRRMAFAPVPSDPPRPTVGRIFHPQALKGLAPAMKEQSE